MKILLILLFSSFTVLGIAQTKVSAPIVPNSPLDTGYATTKALTQLGGFHNVANSAERNAMPIAYRSLNMLVSDGISTWQLVGGLTNDFWQVYTAPLIPNVASDIFNNVSASHNVAGVLYNIVGDYTGELLSYKQITKYADGSTIVDANVDGTYIKKLNGYYYKLTKERITVKDFGAVGDGVTDDQIPLQKALNTCAAWAMDLNIPSGIFIHSGTLIAPGTRSTTGSNGQDNPFYIPTIRGASNTTTILQYTGNGIGFLTSGGSGGVSQGGIYNIAFNGTDSSIGLCVQGRDGFETFHCRFGRNKIGVQYNNILGSPFTEYCIMRNPQFTLECAVEIQYLVSTGGDASFNGSGATEIVANFGNYTNAAGQAVVNTHSAIEILGTALAYNAPLSGQWWIQGEGKILINNASTGRSSYHGNITVENFNSQTGSGISALCSGNRLPFLGTVQAWGASTFGSLYLTDALISYGPVQGNYYYVAPHNETYEKTFIGTDTIYTAGSRLRGEKVSMIVTIDNGENHCQYELTLISTGFGGNGNLYVNGLLWQYGFNPAIPSGLAYPGFFATATGLVVEMLKNDGSMSTSSTFIHVNLSTIGNSLNTIQ